MIVAGALAAPATVASAAGDRCPKGALGAVETAYANVFSNASPLPADERAASLAGAERPRVRAILDDWLARPAETGTTVTVRDIRCRTRNRAIVDADLVLASIPLPDVLLRARAVRQDGTWKVATSTFCRRMSLEDPSLAGDCP